MPSRRMFKQEAEASASPCMDIDPLRSQASGFCSLGLCFLLCKLGGPPAVLFCSCEVYLSIRRPFGVWRSLAGSCSQVFLLLASQTCPSVWTSMRLWFALCDKIEDTEEFQFLDSRLFGLCTTPALSSWREVPRTAAASDTLFPCCSENCYRLPSALARVSWAIIVPLLRGRSDSPLAGLLLGDIKPPWGLSSPARPRATYPVFLEVHFRAVGGPRRDHHPSLPSITLQSRGLMLKEAYCLWVSRVDDGENVLEPRPAPA